MKRLSLYFSDVKKSLDLAIPLLLSECLYSLNYFVIIWLAAQLGKAALAAMALTQAIYMFFMTMIAGICAATAVLTSQDLGAKNQENFKHIFVQSVLLNFLLAFIAGMILWLIPYFLPFLGIKDKQVINLTTIALHAFMWGLFPTTFLVMIEKFLIGLHRTRLVLFFTTFTIPIYMLTNYALVLGKFGLPKCGLAGFGYSQAISYGLLGIMFIIMNFVMPTLRSYKLFAPFRKLTIECKYFFELWRVGWPLGMMFSIEAGAFLSFTFLISLFGTDALAAYQLTRQYLILAFSALMALTESAAVQVGYAVGENDRILLKRYFKASIGITMLFMSVLACFYLLAIEFLLSLDIDITNPKNYQIIFYAKHYITAIALLIFFDGIRDVTAGALRGLKDTKSNMYSSIMGYWLIGLPAAYLFGRFLGFGSEGLWIGFTVGIAISAIYLLVRFHRLSTQVDLKALLLK